MGILDELKKLTHPYDDEDEEYEDFEAVSYTHLTLPTN